MTAPAVGLDEAVETRLEELRAQGYGAALSAAGQDRLDGTTQLALARYPDARVREALAVNHSIGVPAQEILAGDGDAGVRGSLCFHKHLAAHVVERLATDPDEWVRECLVKLQRLPGNVCAQLSYDQSERIVWALGVNPGLPLHDPAWDLDGLGAYSARLVAEVPSVIARAAQHHGVRHDVLHGLAQEWEGSFGTLLEATRSL